MEFDVRGTRLAKVGGRVASVVLTAAVVAVFAGCGFAGASGKTLTLGYLEWDENVANSSLIEVVLEDEFGYEHVDLKLAKGGSRLEDTFEGVASGRLDAFTDVWMPLHRENMQAVGGRVELSEEPWYVGETKYGIAVPNYVDARSLADLNSAGVSMIIGIEPDSGLMQITEERVIPEYGLDLALVEGSTPAMLAEVERAYQAREPIVFLSWVPHWMNQEYDFRYLKDPKKALGSLDGSSRLHSVFRRGLSEDDPVAYALINAMKLDGNQVGELELSIRRAPSPEEGARNWIEKNREVVEPWIEAARRAEN